jgi:hypothetical protein
MPQVTVYIREEDLSIWKAIGKKAEFIHNSLQTAGAYKALPAQERKVVKQVIANIPGVVRGAEFVPKPPDPEKGYPCCQKRSPCKHWHWSDLNEVWENELTGKTRVG